jgi:hypothetical protein
MLEAPSLANAERGREIERYERAGEREIQYIIGIVPYGTST